MQNKIMVLFDSLWMRKGAVNYSIELAKRMDCSLIFLFLLAFDSEEAARSTRLESRAKKALKGPIDKALGAGVQVEAEVRLGSPPSELMKFLAGERSVQTIVWGGYTDLEDLKRAKGHWLARMKEWLEITIVFPQPRS